MRVNIWGVTRGQRYVYKCVLLRRMVWYGIPLSHCLTFPPLHQMIHCELDADCRVNISAVEKAINSHTMLIVGSAPQYPHGVIDPIEKL